MHPIGTLFIEKYSKDVLIVTNTNSNNLTYCYIGIGANSWLQQKYYTKNIGALSPNSITEVETLTQTPFSAWPQWVLDLMPTGKPLFGINPAAMSTPAVPYNNASRKLFTRSGTTFLKEPLDLFNSIHDTGLVASKCEHQFKEYVGFTEVYQYCSLCNLKKRA